MIENLEGAFVLIRAKAERQAKRTNNDLVTELHTCLLKVGMKVDEEMKTIRNNERKANELE